jgi:RNA polymerase sigma factor (sigma-70 family)
VASSPDIPTLVAACRDGDETAWKELVSRFENLVFSTALGTGLDQDVAVDVFQQVWLELYRSLRRIRDPQSIPRWLITTTRRIAYKHAAARGRWVNDVRENLVDPSPSADSLLVALEQRDRLEAAMAGLDQRCRDVVALFFYADQKISYREVAAKTGLSEDSVGSLKTRCLDRLKDLLGNAL